MTDTTGAINGVTFFDGRVLYPGGYRRVIRGDFISFSGVVTAGLLIATVAVTAACMINASISTDRRNQCERVEGAENARPRQIRPNSGECCGCS